jgi:unsaturated rhamnogalacturonyl hydrolase
LTPLVAPLQNLHPLSSAAFCRQSGFHQRLFAARVPALSIAHRRANPCSVFRNARMSSIRPSVFFAAALCAVASLTSQAQSTEFGGARPLLWSVRLADSEVNRLGSKIAYPSGKWDYANFLFVSSLLGIDARLGEPRYRPFAQQSLDSFLDQDGRAIHAFILEDYNIDNVAPGRALFQLHAATQEPRYRHAIEILRQQLKTHPRTSEGGFWHKKRYPHQMWLDGLFMASPFYAQYGRVFNEAAAFDDVAEQIKLVDKYTYDQKTGLFFHGWDESRTQPWADKTTGTSPNFWSRAIGWYAMALVDVLDELPANHSARPEIVAIFKKVADGIVKYQDASSGLWWQVTDQGSRKGNYLEATASSMFVYSLAKAINQGTVSRDYLPAVLKGYESIVRTFIKTNATDGSVSLTQCCKVAGLGYGRDGSFEYYISEPIVDNDAKGTGPFILAGIEIEKLVGLSTPLPRLPAAPSLTQSGASTGTVLSTTPGNSGSYEKVWAQVPPILARIKAPTFPDKEFSIADYGAPTDGKSLATDAIRRAIEACHAAGGGRVLVPAGTYVTGAVHLKSNVNLHIDEGAKLLFSTDPAHYMPTVLSRWEGVECYNFSPLIYALDQENIAITGKGTIDGQAGYENWWGWVKKSEEEKLPNPPGRGSRNRLLAEGEGHVPLEKRVYGLGHYLRPPLIQPYRCKNVLIEDVTLLRSPFWVVNPVLCQNVTVRGVTIFSHGPNNDGVDPESCRDVLIENTKFDTGDDCIAIKSGRNEDGRRLSTPSENIVVRNCSFKDGHGGVVLGSECSGHIRNVFVENCEMDSPNLDRGLRFKNNALRGGILENVHMRNVRIGRVAEAVLTIDLLYEEGAQGPHKPIVRNVSMENVTSTGSPRVMYIRGFENAVIDNIRIANSTFTGITATEVIQHAGEITLSNVDIVSAKPTRALNSVTPPAAK